MLLEEDVVWQDHSRRAAGFQNRKDVLDEVELLVRGGDGEVVPARHLAAALGAEGRIGQDAVIAPIAWAFGYRVAVVDVGLDAVEIQVHQSQAARLEDDLAAGEGALLQAHLLLSIRGLAALLEIPLGGGDQEAGRADGGIVDRIIRAWPISGRTQRTMARMAARGVKYCPAPFCSAAYFWSRPS